MNKEFSLKNTVVAILKCMGLIMLWVVIQSLVTAVVSTIIQLSGLAITPEELTNQVMSKQTEILLIANCATILIFALYYKRKGTTLFERSAFAPITVRNGISTGVLGVAFQYAILLVLSIIPFPESW